MRDIVTEATEEATGRRAKWVAGVFTQLTPMANSASGLEGPAAEHACKEPSDTEAGTPTAQKEMRFPGGRCGEGYSMQMGPGRAKVWKVYGTNYKNKWVGET